MDFLKTSFNVLRQAFWPSDEKQPLFAPTQTFSAPKQEWWVVNDGDEIGYPRSFSQLKTHTGLQDDAPICSTCAKLNCLTSTLWEKIQNFEHVTWQHHETMEDLVKTAFAGCHMCCLLVMAIEQNGVLQKDGNEQWYSKEGFDSVVLDSYVQLRFQRCKGMTPATDVFYDEVRIFVRCGNMPANMEGRLICSPKFPAKRSKKLPDECAPSIGDRTTGSKAAFARMRFWLSHCQQSHPMCNRKDEHLLPRLPTRVISVGEASSPECRLESGADRRGHYATLSHCWGDTRNRPLTTTDATLESRQQEIRGRDLPETFRDAIRICRELQIPYLWIDSLCIIQEQESQEDWTKEAPRMGDVYVNSALTIVAAAAQNGSAGCFRERAGFAYWPCQVQMFDRSLYISRFPTKSEESGDPGDLNSITQLPLYSRGWVLQEQILSRRSLVFTNNQLIWRCSTTATNEKYPFGIPHAPRVSMDNTLLLRQIVTKTTRSDVWPHVNIYISWYRMIEDFSSRKLTYDDDKLPAISGIAKSFAKATGGEAKYVAGIWEPDLITGLLWHAISQSDRDPRIPSWSWASVSNQVTFRHMLPVEPRATILPKSLLLKIKRVDNPKSCDQHPFGLCSEASIRLYGALLPVVRSDTDDSGLILQDFHIPYAEVLENYILDSWDKDPDSNTPWFFLPVCVRHDPYHRGVRTDYIPYKASWEKSLRTGVDEFEWNNRVFGLLLRAVDNRYNTYSRVGCGIISKSKGTAISRISFERRRYLTLI